MSNHFDVLLSEEVQTFIKSLDPKAQRKVAYNIQKSKRVRDTKILKKLNDDIWEFRIRYAKMQIRLLAFWDIESNALIICTNGFVKKTRKTPKLELEKAKEFRKRYYNRKR